MIYVVGFWKFFFIENRFNCICVIIIQSSIRKIIIVRKRGKIFVMNLNEEVLFRYFYRKWMVIFD